VSRIVVLRERERNLDYVYTLKWAVLAQCVPRLAADLKVEDRNVPQVERKSYTTELN
jgi:hypothetical protein